MPPLIQWYPGHIAKAEKALKEQLKRVDVVIEVRDARIPLASCHPRMAQWIEGRSHLLVLNRVDLIPSEVKLAWQDWFVAQKQTPIFTNAQAGKGVKGLLKATAAAGAHVNQRRQKRGMLPRPVRAVVIGFPNVGKSALINRLLKKRAVESANRPGVTRQLRWIRISDQIELLDTPGILPPLLDDQDAALKLAICDDIGTASYEYQLVAAAAVEILARFDAPFADRYGLAYERDQYGSGMGYIKALAEASYQNDTERAARKILHDYRKGRLGAIALETPPDAHEQV
jgi:ribosome biogenesis GTPase A